MKIVIATVLALLLVNGAGAIQAEKATIDVPFDSKGTSCWYDEIKIEYHCTWKGEIQVFTLEDLKMYEDVIEPELYEKEFDRLEEIQIQSEKSKLTDYEKIIIEIERKIDKGIANSNDATLRNLLLDLEKCQQGMDERTTHIQTAREFQISGFKHLTSNNVKIDGLLGKIAMSIQECKAQKEVFKLSVGYQNMVSGDNDIQYSLSQKYTPDVKAVNYDKLHATSNEVHRGLICDDNQHSDQYKKQFGCIVLYDGLDEAEIKRQNEIRFGTDGKIRYQSQILDDYMEFLKLYGNKYATSQDRQNQADIAEPIANEWKKDHNFYKNSLK